MPAVGTVRTQDRKLAGNKQVLIHHIDYAGGDVKLKLEHSVAPGSPGDLLILEGRPEVAIQGRQGDSFLDLVRRGLGLGTALLGLCVFLFCTVAGPVKTWDALRGVGTDPPG